MGTLSLLKAGKGGLVGLFILVASTLSYGKTVLVMGDSLSAAYGIDPEEGWVSLLATQLAPEHSVVNASISGETSQGGLNRFPSLLAEHAPDIVILELGANDGLRGFPIKRITQNLESMIELAKLADATLVLVGIRLPPNFGSRYTEPFFQQYQHLAEKHGLLYLPFLLEGVAQNPELMQSDGLHPTAQAQPIILNSVWPWLQKALNRR